MQERANHTCEKLPVAKQTEYTIPICVSSDEGLISAEELDSVLKDIPTDFLMDDKAIFTRLTQLHNPLRVIWIVKHVQYRSDLMQEELEKVKALVMKYADIFACSLGEFLPVPGAIHRLDILDGMTFNLRVHQRPLTPLQLQFLHGKVDEMLDARIIEYAPPEAVKCCASTVLTKKAHKQEGMMLEELQRAVNEQCKQHGQTPAFTLPECKMQEGPEKVNHEVKPQKW